MAATGGVGVTSLFFAVPRASVRHAALEAADGVPAGKYTVGLGQTAMAVCDANEDAVTLGMTALQGLLDHGGVAAANVGRLEVGTETLTDKAKSAKTALMPLLSAVGNHSVEGVDCLNACYGAVAGLFNAAAWVESSAWDGRVGVVVGTDIAIYGTQSARPTGGAGAIALAVGPNAPLQLEGGLRASYMAHAYDFFKPELESEYPIVDGHVSNRCFLQALDACFHGYAAKFASVAGRPFLLEADADYVLFHTPYSKLVQRAFARLTYLDARQRLDHPFWQDPALGRLLSLSPDTTHDHAELDKTFRTASQALFDARVAPSLGLPREIGNSYCACIFSALVSLLHTVGSDALQGKRILLFAYGSGLTSTMFSMRVCGDLAPLIAPSHLDAQLADRVVVSPARFLESLEARQRLYNQRNAVPPSNLAWIRPGGYYLERVADYRRHYARNSPAAPSQ